MNDPSSFGMFPQDDSRSPMGGGSITADISASGEVAYAGFWIRFLAYLIDCFFILLLFIPLLLLCEATLGPSGGSREKYISYSINFLYFVLTASSVSQASWGKQILGLKIIRVDGEKIDLTSALFRYAASLLSASLLLYGYAMIGWSREKRGLHDIMCKTRVIYRRGRRIPIV